jgi:hypothetical protein
LELGLASGYLRESAPSGGIMRTRSLGIGLVSAVILSAGVGLTRHTASPDVTVHEWGTFTTVAGTDGAAIEWLALGGPTDLPCFVRHVQAPLQSVTPDPVRRVTTGPITKGEVIVGSMQPLTFEQARTQLWGKVRMETPVIYFYSSADRDVTVDVSFPRGVITEFFPAPENPIVQFSAANLRNPNHVHSLRWNVKVSPAQAATFPGRGDDSHYYSARATDATPLRVGEQAEKFIFYRGVAGFDVPIRTIVMPNDSVQILNTATSSPIPVAILFENRGGKIGYRVVRSLTGGVTLPKPALDGNLASLRNELRGALVDAGLYQKEANAMLDTWRDSWFEEGTRVFYLFPRTTIDAVLPLTMNPAPAAVARVFVGRMEVIDATTLRVVSAALQSNDDATLNRYVRFLEPITNRIIAKGADGATATHINVVANQAYAKYNKDSRTCQ